MPKISHEYFRKMAQYLNSTEKAYRWFETQNPLLGGLSPMDMIKLGRQNKLKLVIDNMVKGIYP